MENPIPASILNDFIFCPLSIYYHRLYSDLDIGMYQQVVQLAGTNAHHNVDKGIYSTKKNVLSGIDGYCARYNLLCKIDIFYVDEKRLVERKKKIHQVFDGQIFQLYAQYFCLIEMGYEVEKLELYSMSDNKKYKISLPSEDNSMFKKFRDTIDEIISFDYDSFYPVNKSKCENCIYEPACERSLLVGEL